MINRLYAQDAPREEFMREMKREMLDILRGRRSKEIEAGKNH